MDDISSYSKIHLYKVSEMLLQAQFYPVGRVSSVGIATGYRMNGTVIESRWGRNISHPSRPALGPTQVPIQWATGLSQGKAAGAWR